MSWTSTSERRVIGCFEILTIVVFSPYRLTHLALPHLQKTRGNVINTSSVCAISKQKDSPVLAIYGTSKAALDTWVKYDSARFAKLGVRINNINPGPFDTNIISRSLPEDIPEEAKTALSEKIGKDITDSGPLKRWGKLDELVPAYLLLADNNASSFTLGSCWIIDGGMAYYGSESSYKSLQIKTWQQWINQKVM